MTIHAKIGTLPGTYLRLRGLRKPPTVGQFVLGKDATDPRRVREQVWQRFRVVRIDDWEQGHRLYLLERI